MPNSGLPAHGEADGASASTILIIDDNPTTIRMLCAIVQAEGDVLFATDGPSGLALARERRPALILLDVEMAGMDGYEVCRQLKAEPFSSDCAIIFVTARLGMESEVRALDAGAVDFITKPLNPPVVLARVRTHLRLQRHGQAMAKLARRDSLTGLVNRRHFVELAEVELLRHRRQQMSLGIAFIDIDFFKLYNDGYGHQAGDACLVTVAHCLQTAARRPGECVARFGGEEFVVLLPYAGQAEALAFGEWCCAEVAALCLPHAWQPGAGHVSVSIGVTAAIPGEGMELDAMLAAADAALYEAKRGGRRRAVWGAPG